MIPSAARPEDRGLCHAWRALAERMPHFSAERVFTGGQLLGLWLGGSALLAALALAPSLTATLLVGALSLFFLASFAFKALLFFTGAAQAPGLAPDGDAVPAPARYTILVPLYREAAIAKPLVEALDRLDYPSALREVLLLVEADDEETAGALAGLDLPTGFTILTVPSAGPRTKPKALNYGLAQASGDFVVVYDAEDQPEPDQLRRALAAFRQHPETVCLQARLTVYNARESALTRLFALDYCLWFDYFLPGLATLDAPVSLGGSSNHFRRTALEAAGAWDPYNVTEDADLGLRLRRMGFAVRTLAASTYEEAPPTLALWLRQRSRWMKGYAQTWLVHMREPRRLYRDLGFRGFLSVQMFLGGTMLAGLANPILWGLFLAWLAGGSGVLGGATGPALLAISLIGLIGGNALLVFLALLAPLRRGWFWLMPAALLMPLYWLLLSLAAWRAFFALFLRPFHWAKTDHGGSRYRPQPGLDTGTGAP